MNMCRPDLPVGYVGLNLGPPQDQKGPPANCGTHRLNCRCMISSINIHQNFMSSLFIKLSFFHLIRFRFEGYVGLLAALTYNKNIVACSLQYCSVLGVSIT